MNRPFFNSAWAASLRIYDPVNPGLKVARVIGGYVEKNINNPDPSQKWNNTCAVRMSYILNESGVTIPKITGKTVSGKDKRQYFFASVILLHFLTVAGVFRKLLNTLSPLADYYQAKKGSSSLKYPVGQMQQGMPRFSMDTNVMTAVISMNQE